MLGEPGELLKARARATAGQRAAELVQTDRRYQQFMDRWPACSDRVEPFLNITISAGMAGAREDPGIKQQSHGSRRFDAHTLELVGVEVRAAGFAPQPGVHDLGQQCVVMLLCGSCTEIFGQLRQALSFTCGQRRLAEKFVGES